MNTKAVHAKQMLFVVIITVTALFQNTVLPCSGIKHTAYLLIPMTVSVAMSESEIPAMLLGLFAGLLWDLASPLPNGITALFFTLFACSCCLLSRYIFRKTLLTGFVLTALGCAVYFATLKVPTYIVHGISAIPLITAKSFIPSSAATLLSTPIFWFPIRYIDKKSRKKAGAQP